MVRAYPAATKRSRTGAYNSFAYHQRAVVCLSPCFCGRFVPGQRDATIAKVWCEYCIINANPPLIGSIAAAVLLRTIADDRLYAKVRDDLDVILDPDSAAIVRETIEMFVEQAVTDGGMAILSQLEDTLSNFLTISHRLEITGTGNIATLLTTLISLHCSSRF
jgi:hypothetical protein